MEPSYLFVLEWHVDEEQHKFAIISATGYTRAKLVAHDNKIPEEAQIKSIGLAGNQPNNSLIYTGEL